MLEVLDFYADWCGPCHMMGPIIEELKKEYSDQVKFSIINTDEEQEKSIQFGVLSIPTYVFLREGQEVDRIIGYTPKASFAARLSQHLSGTA